MQIFRMSLAETEAIKSDPSRWESLSPQDKKKVYTHIWDLQHPEVRRQRSREDYSRNRSRRIYTTREGSQKAKRELIQAYGGACEFCGEDHSEYLELDHIDCGFDVNEKGKKVTSTWLYRKLRSEGFPKKNHRLLCSNCNQCRRKYGDVVARSLGSERKNERTLLTQIESREIGKEE